MRSATCQAPVLRRRLLPHPYRPVHLHHRRRRCHCHLQHHRRGRRCHLRPLQPRRRHLLLGLRRHHHLVSERPTNCRNPLRRPIRLRNLQHHLYRCRLLHRCRHHPERHHPERLRPNRTPVPTRRRHRHLMLGCFPRQESFAASCWDLQRSRETCRHARPALSRSTARPP